jgi:hypothetical protein
VHAPSALQLVCFLVEVIIPNDANVLAMPMEEVMLFVPCIFGIHNA